MVFVGIRGSGSLDSRRGDEMGLGTTAGKRISFQQVYPPSLGTGAKKSGWVACWVLAEPRRPGIVVNFESDRLKKPLNPRATQLCSQRFFGELIEMTE